MVESPKPKTSASCPTTLRNKSASPTPTPFVDGGTPATFSMDSLQEIQEYLSRAREGIRKDKKTSGKKPWYLAKIFRKARKVVTSVATQKNNPSNTACDVLPTEQNASLVVLPISQAASVVLSTAQRSVALAEPQDRLATTKRNASAPGNVFGVTSDQVQPVESIVNQDNAGAKQADEVPIVDTATSCFTDTVNPDSCPESPHIADDPPPTDRSSGPESYTLSTPIPRKLRHCLSSPILSTTHPFRSVSNSTLVDCWPLSITIPPLSTPSPITETGTQDEESEASQDSRASSPYENFESSHVGRPYQVSDVYKARVAGAIQTLKYTFETDLVEHLVKAIAKAKVVKDEEWAERLEEATGQTVAAKDEEWTKRSAKAIVQAGTKKDEEWTERLDEAVAQAEAARDEEWTECLEKAVAQAEATKDKELDTFDRFKESGHQNEIKDLEEDHEHEIRELEERHAETLQKLATEHEEEVLKLVKNHGAETRKLELRRASGAKEVTRLKQELSETEDEKMTTEKDLVHMTGQRDALHKAFVAMTGQFSPSQINQNQIHYPQEAENVDETANRESATPVLAKANMSSQTTIPATLSNTRQPHPHPPPQPNHPSIVPHSLYPRVQILESENALLRTELDQRHQDVAYATKKSDNLRALLEADPAISDIYADVLIHKETIQDLHTRLQESWQAVEREKLESTRLGERIDIVVEELKKVEVEKNVAVVDKETAWAQNENLLRDLKAVFGKSDFDKAFWTHYESLVREKEGLEGEVKAYKVERYGFMEEAVDTKARISQLELDLAVAASKADTADEEEGGLQHLRNQLLTVQIENETLRAEIEFQVAEVENLKVGPEMPRGLKEVQEQVLEEKNREIEDLRARLEGDGAHGGNFGGDEKDHGVEGIGGCVGTPKSDTSFF